MIVQNDTNTFCIRCGKVRVFLRKWTGKDNDKGSLITHVETKCPDAECQQLVDEKFQEMKDRRELSLNKKKSVVLTKPH